MKHKRPLGLIITIIILVVIIIAMGMTLLARRSTPLDGVFRNYFQKYHESLLSIQYLTGENAQQTADGISVYCPGFDVDSYYMAQFDNFGTQKSILYVVNPISGRTMCVIDRSTNLNQTRASISQDLLATINGEPVYLEEVMGIYRNLPLDSRTNESLQQALDTVIRNKLLLQDATTKEFSVSEEDIDNAINTYLANNGLTLEQLQQSLENSGSSLTAFRVGIKNNLLLLAEIDDVTQGVAEPSEADIKAYYDSKKESFVTLASAVTRQLMIYANESNKDTKLEITKAIADEFDGSNFCELVEKYSEDTPSISRCGLYSFQQGQLLPEYEQVVFNSEPGSTKIIQSRLGYHIVQVVNVTLPKEVSLEEAEEAIVSLLVLRNKQAVLNQHIISLREQADVVSYID